MIDSSVVETDRLRTQFLESGNKTGVPLVLVHGNLSSSVFFTEVIRLLAPDYWCLAPDLRGFGTSESKLINAERGARDWSDDLYSLFQYLNIQQAHLLGWSAGAGIIMQFMLDYPERVKSLSLVAPISPYGFGGSKDEIGTPVTKDCAGSGAGMVRHSLTSQLFAEGKIDKAFAEELFSSFYIYAEECEFDPSYLIDAIAQQAVGEQCYPGDSLPSTNWPCFKPGKWGPMNALSPYYFNTSGISELTMKAPILWVQGEYDQVIANRSPFDPAVLGASGEIANWPGELDYPPQPMVDQTRQVLQNYERKGGKLVQHIIPQSAHAPFLDQPSRFIEILQNFLGSADKS